MPTYEYQCEHCGYKFEKFQKMSDKALKECPKCGKEIRRLIGEGMGVIFKGKADYKDNSFSGETCCGRTERCDTPPCSEDGVCKR
jgi:putative FmdB family regulatory protein